MVTIREVAAAAGVSVGTVSKVLNHVYVKPANKKKVEDAIRELGYQVNTYAQGLRAQQTYTVAMIVPDLINPFFALLVNYVEQVLTAMGYRLLVCNSHCNVDRELAYINMTRQNKVDGLIFITYSDLEEYLEGDIPMVSIDRHFRNRTCCISSDNAMGGRLAAQKFIATGCRNVIYIRNGSNLEGETLKRGEAFAEACLQAGIQTDLRNFGEETTLDRKQVRRIHDFLEKCVENGRFVYDGIFTSSDIHAVAVYQKLYDMHIRIPEDVQLIGYDGLRILNTGNYAVSSIAQPVKDMAVACVDVLVKMIEKKPVPEEIILPVRFVNGGTTR